MTWIFYDFFEHFSMQGPMPMKRWQRDGKKYRIHHRSRVPWHKGPMTNDERDRKVVEYARWLAARDRIDVGKGAVVWRAHIRLRSTGRFENRPTDVCFSGGGKRVIISIPNWDFDPPQPKEELINEPEQASCATSTSSNDRRRERSPTSDMQSGRGASRRPRKAGAHASRAAMTSSPTR